MHQLRKVNITQKEGLKLLLEICIISGLSGIFYELIDIKQVTLSGFIQGIFFGVGFWAMELYWVQKWKKVLLKQPLLFSIIVKSLIFLVIIVLVNRGVGIFRNLLEGKSFLEYITPHFTIEQLVLYLYVLILFFSLSFYMQLKNFFGQNTLSEILWGKYRKPHKEYRVFMFMDIKSSTRLAENLGLEKYYSFLDDFFHEITEPVKETKAEIYQYVGDEVVFSWPLSKNDYKANSIDLFFKVKDQVQMHRGYYLNTYGEIPQFKAGMHYGEVISAQIGDLKRELVFNGDVLNTTARIQEQCNKNNAELIVSGQLLKIVDLNDSYVAKSIEKIQLRGKEEFIELFEVNRISE